MAVEKLSALLWDTSFEQRNSLKQLLRSTERYGNFGLCSSAREVIKKLETEKWDVLLVPSVLASDKIADFVKDLKQTEHGEVVVLINSVATADQNPAAIAARHTFGIHACLMEPYSVDDVASVTNQAFTLREELQHERNVRAVSDIIDETMKFIDLVSTKMKVGIDPGRTLKSLKDSGKVIKSLPRELRDIYYDQIVDKLIAAKVPEFIPGVENYTGKSPAMRRRAQKKREAIRNGTASAFDGEVKDTWIEPEEKEDGSVTPPTRA